MSPTTTTATLPLFLPLRALLFLTTSALAPTAAATTAAFEGHSVRNLRPIHPGSPIYRAATLDGLAPSDARDLLDGAGSSALGGRPLSAVVDLRNADEIARGAATRTDGAELFYSSLAPAPGTGAAVIGDDDDDGDDGRTDPPRPALLYHAPLLGDVDAFWDEAISRLDPAARLAGTVRTAFDGGALDRAAARRLEEGGLAELYTVMLASAPRRMGRVLEICSTEVAGSRYDEGRSCGRGGAVIVHCQKGKDRTGVISMLLQCCLGATDEDLVEAYSASGGLLGEGGGGRGSGDEKREGGSDGGGSMVDWSRFRGSPRSAMVSTLDWIRGRHGSVDGYLDLADFGSDRRMDLREKLGILR